MGEEEEVAVPPEGATDEKKPGQTVIVLGESRDEGEVKLRWNIRRTAHKPCACCCALCGVWFLLFILLIILSATAGSIEFSLDVPFYDQGEINQQREDAVAATERDADLVSGLGNAEASECVHDDPTILDRNGTLIRGPMPSASCQRSSSSEFRLLYISKDRTSNIFTEKNMRQIQEVEDHFLANIELSRYCYLLDLTYGPFETRNPDDWVATASATDGDVPSFVACQRMSSILNFLDPLYFDRNTESGLGYYLIPSDQVTQEYNFSALNDVIDYWSDFNTRTYDLTSLSFAVTTVGDSITIQNLLWPVTSSDFRVGDTDAVGVTSTYALGHAINEYDSPSDDILDQYADTGRWLWNEFDSYLKGLDLDGIDVYWSDSENGMQNAEAERFALQSMALLPAAFFAVLIYLMFMQDSMYIGAAGIMQIVLSFIPTILFYRYIIGEDYLGFLNMIALFIIMGIGVDDIFVFCDQFNHNHGEKRFDIRLQKTYNVAGKAMFTTSCTTFVSFIANASSAFPAVRTFGIFAALLVLMNYLAIITFFPAVYAVYYTRIRKVWWDHPSLLCCFCCCKKDLDDDDEDEHQEGKGADGNEENEASNGEDAHGGSADSALVRFFRDTWAPLIIKLRYVIVLIFTGIAIGAIILAAGLEPDDEATAVLPDGNQYLEYPEVLLEHFARAGNPRAIDVVWISGINPDDPIDRSGTDDTNVTDYGRANYLDCSTYNPSTPAAQVWALQTCHDLFFGNVTEYHGDSDAFGPDGANGPMNRRVVTENVQMDEFSYYTVVSCPIQGIRDWFLTDPGCVALQSVGLQCQNETSQRAGCTQWDINGNSCEPFPVPEENLFQLFALFLEDTSLDPTTQQTYYDKYAEQVFVADDPEFNEEIIVQADFSCRTGGDLVVYAMSTRATLDEDSAQGFEDGIDLFELWDQWSVQMRAFAPREMIGTMQVSTGAWSFYYLNETLIEETFRGIGLALGLSFLILTIIGGNIILAFFAVLNICLIVIDVLALIMSW